MSETSNKKLQKIHDRAKWIIKAEKTWDSIATIRKRRVAIDVYRHINEIESVGYNSKFSYQDHKYNTRGNGSLVQIPKVKTEAGRSTFGFQGALIFNQLDANIRNEKYYTKFKRKLAEYDF